MPLTEIDTRPALLVLDVQDGIVAMPTLVPGNEIAQRAGQLARAFRERGFPVVLVNLAGAPSGRTDSAPKEFNPPEAFTVLRAELDPRDTDHFFTKRQWGAFVGTSVDPFLKEQGVTQLFIAGIATTMAVESSARNAHDLGYNVVVVADVITDFDPDAHRHSLEKIFPMLGEVATSNEILEKLGEAMPAA